MKAKGDKVMNPAEKLMSKVKIINRNKF